MLNVVFHFKIKIINNEILYSILFQQQSQNQLENYHILLLIGEGSFGQVYKGRLKKSNQIAALKFISKIGKLEK
ncbi:unnamed protein product [Paramecium sonneborni]|uniref:non-specific serine/threonine protein kinase n=1 Tax=Paramecium sonneborni TaxID=65129 RepID=A0A8S1KY18_9CILI|nr:unnamed protein product [Paramecium sonneborni]